MQDPTAILSRLPELGGKVCRASELKLRLRRQETPSPLPSGIGRLNELLGGGWPRSALSEIYGPISSGRFALLLSSLRYCLESGARAALIDQGHHLAPYQARELGIDITALLWVRPNSLNESLACAEMILSAGFPLVAIDLGLPPVRGHVSPAAWLRLSRLSEEYQAVSLLSSPYRISGCAARTVLTMRQRNSRWIGENARVRLLGGLWNHVKILRSPEHPHNQGARLRLDVPEADFRLPGQLFPTSNIDQNLEVEQHA